MPLVTALSMIDTASFTSAEASLARSSTAVRAFLTAVRRFAIAARLRARCLIIFRFCFSADAILATAVISQGERVVNPPGAGSQARWTAAADARPREGGRPRFCQSARGSTHGGCG